MVLLTDSEKLSRQLNQASKLTFDLEFTFQKNTIHQIQFSTLKRIIFLAIAYSEKGDTLHFENALAI